MHCAAGGGPLERLSALQVSAVAHGVLLAAKRQRAPNPRLGRYIVRCGAGAGPGLRRVGTAAMQQRASCADAEPASSLYEAAAL